MTKSYFITGTNTEVGKTTIAATLLQMFNQQGYQTAAFKPIASGCVNTLDGLRNDDGIKLQAATSIAMPYEIINPIALKQPIAPHLAAELENKTVSVARLQKHYEKIHSYNPDIIIIEGSGGWLVPLNTQETLADFVVKTNLPVILVVGIKLGCLNHTLLTYENMLTRRVILAGWIANIIDKNALAIHENIAALKQKIRAPLLGIVPYLDNLPIKSVEKFINNSLLS